MILALSRSGGGALRIRGMVMSTICAVSTALSEGGIAVIRISGEGAIDIAERVFRPKTAKSVRDMEGYTCAHGDIMDGDRVVDDGVLTVFRAPRSYTGEDVCEISCHGGVYVTKRVLRLCLDRGAEPAQKGEFTRRALLNGKLSLTQAEAVMDSISAQGEFALASANHIREGRLFRQVSEVSRELVRILGSLAAWVDYPEDDLPDIETPVLRESLVNALAVTESLIRDSDSGMALRTGIDTVIAGKPNVGKSTLMNLLLGFERAIVTDIAGTTRDIIEETVRLGRLTLRVSDTAGLHPTQDPVEAIGVGLARKRLEGCMLAVGVFDGSQVPDEYDRELLALLKGLGKRTVLVLNKSDLDKAEGWEELYGAGFPVVELSAKHERDARALAQTVEGLFGTSDLDPDSIILVNERQRACAVRARDALRGAVDALDMGETLDAATVMIDTAASALLELTGERVTEAVVDEVFSRFCVGK